jgi:hypothetical protein
MTAGAAVLAIWAALLAGWYAAKWHTAETDEISARARLANAVKGMWAARRVLAVVVVIAIVLVDLWFRGKGRG